MPGAQADGTYGLESSGTPHISVLFLSVHSFQKLSVVQDALKQVDEWKGMQPVAYGSLISIAMVYLGS
jgi:hypothetical protein